MAGFSWNSLKYTFDNRHDFESEELNQLKKHFPHTEFKNIPEAWIIVIDDMLKDMREPGSVKLIRQEYGQLVVEFRDGFKLSDNDKIIQEAESRIYKLDKDIRNEHQDSMDSPDEGKVFN